MILSRGQHTEYQDKVEYTLQRWDLLLTQTVAICGQWSVSLAHITEIKGQEEDGGQRRWGWEKKGRLGGEGK